MPSPVPQTFPSPVQAAVARPSLRSPKTGGQRMATAAQQVPNPGNGRGADRRTQAPWRVEAPNWGSVCALRRGHFISTPTSSRVQVDDTFVYRGELAPLPLTNRIRHRTYPSLDERTYNTAAISELQYIQLAKNRAQSGRR